jgi:hypothetical protein
MIVWLASYPRSGNTLLRVILNRSFGITSYSVYNDPIDIGADRATASAVGHASLPAEWCPAAARDGNDTWFVKTHDLQPGPDKAIYVIRDGREAMVSFLNYLTHYGREPVDLSDVVTGAVPFGSWSDHVEGWDPAARPDTLLLRYEELAADPVAHLPVIARFIGRDTVPGVLPTFADLHAVNPAFFRSGRVDSWKGVFSEDLHRLFWVLHGGVMLRYGYGQGLPPDLGLLDTTEGRALADAVRIGFRSVALKRRALAGQVGEERRIARQAAEEVRAVSKELRADIARFIMRVWDLEDENKGLAAGFGDRGRELDRMQRTVSWRLSYPLRKAAAALGGRKAPSPPPVRAARGIDLSGQMEEDYGRHRSGLKYGLRHLLPLHDPAGAALDIFVERTFLWDGFESRPHRKPWVGFIHIPPSPPGWFHQEQSNEALMATAAWKRSLPLCRGLFTLSEHHRRHLETMIDIPMETILLPTETPDLTWSEERFLANPRRAIVQVGWWLRKLHAIHQLPRSDYRKILLSVEHPSLPVLMAREREILMREGTFTPDMYATVENMSYRSDEEYDRLLAENIVFCHLYDSSANNAVVECIVRNTPILVNPIDPVREYLGDAYPFYFDSHEEAVSKAMDLDLVIRAHRYLVDLPVKARLSGDGFRGAFTASGIYRSLLAG